MIKSGTTGSISNHRNGLVHVQINRIAGNKQTSETTWVKPLGGDLYKITSPLHFISGFDVGDVVSAVGNTEEAMPTVIEVVKRGEYRTLHIAFAKALPIADQQAVLNVLKKWNATHEMALERFYTIVVSSQENYDAICDYLKSLGRAKVLRYEPGVDIDTLLRMRFLEL